MAGSHLVKFHQLAASHLVKFELQVSDLSLKIQVDFRTQNGCSVLKTALTVTDLLVFGEILQPFGEILQPFGEISSSHLVKFCSHLVKL